MKKSKKFILAILVILIAAIVLILMNPNWIESKDVDDTVETENVDAIDNPFDEE